MNDWTINGKQFAELAKVKRMIQMGLSTFAEDNESYSKDLNDMLDYVNEKDFKMELF